MHQSFPSLPQSNRKKRSELVSHVAKKIRRNCSHTRVSKKVLLKVRAAQPFNHTKSKKETPQRIVRLMLTLNAYSAFLNEGRLPPHFRNCPNNDILKTRNRILFGKACVLRWNTTICENLWAVNCRSTFRPDSILEAFRCSQASVSNASLNFHSEALPNTRTNCSSRTKFDYCTCIPS